MVQRLRRAPLRFDQPEPFYTIARVSWRGKYDRAGERPTTSGSCAMRVAHQAICIRVRSSSARTISRNEMLFRHPACALARAL